MKSEIVKRGKNDIYYALMKDKIVIVFILKKKNRSIRIHWAMHVNLLSPSDYFSLFPFSSSFSFFFLSLFSTEVAISSSPPSSHRSSTRPSPWGSLAAGESTPRSLVGDDRRRNRKSSPKYNVFDQFFTFSDAVRRLFREVGQDLKCTLKNLQNHTPLAR